MRVKRVIAVTGILLAVAACGDDGRDAAGGSAAADAMGATPTVEDEAPGSDVGEAPESREPPTHEEQTHEEQTHEEPTHEQQTHEQQTDGQRADGEAGDSADEAAPASTDRSDEMHAVDHVEAGSEHGTGEPDADHVTVPVDDTPSATDAPSVIAPDTDEGIVVEVEMVEFGYVLDRETVPVGEPITFRFVNTGQIEHEAMFGSAHEQEEFAASGDHGGHDAEGHHGEIAAITLDTGTTGEMMIVFDTPGEVLIGCHLPGHWDAGMATALEVVTT